MTLLDIGGGIRPHPDATCIVDLYNTSKGYKQWDLNKFPYPFEDKSFDIVYSRMNLEHVAHPIETVNEMYRIAKKKIIIIVPHYSSQCAFNSIGHRNYFASNSFSEFYAPGDSNSLNKKWKGTPKVTLRYADNKGKLKFLNPIYNPIINWKPVAMERYFIPLIWCGIDEIKFEFTKEE